MWVPCASALCLFTICGFFFRPTSFCVSLYTASTQSSAEMTYANALEHPQSMLLFSSLGQGLARFDVKSNADPRLQERRFRQHKANPFRADGWMPPHFIEREYNVKIPLSLVLRSLFVIVKAHRLYHPTLPDLIHCLTLTVHRDARTYGRYHRFEPISVRVLHLDRGSCDPKIAIPRICPCPTPWLDIPHLTQSPCISIYLARWLVAYYDAIDPIRHLLQRLRKLHSR